ncbi:hypothetical protein BDN71DRAFT_1181296 [Pleurotus eryngii]|uniref:Uncharacterized protein n=1 Tax=Pleurotus eryngii TaxID=5323 RepID=A0A9P5ZSV8_PLEER|nr:hypothetical protein BDN71DRAFT_1181296 [Pleurotus eryngii]
MAYPSYHTAKIKAIRLPPVGPEVKERNQIGEITSLEDAKSEFGVAEVIEGPMFMWRLSAMMITLPHTITIGSAKRSSAFGESGISTGGARVSSCLKFDESHT